MKKTKAGMLILTVVTVIVLATGNETPVLNHFVYLPIVARGDAGGPVALANPGFEMGYGGGCSFYHASIGHHTFCYDEQDVPAGWTFGWYEGFAEGLCYSGLTGRPEANLSDRRHPDDVAEGDYSAHAFCFWRCARFWWGQSVPTTPGRFYTFGARVRTWPGSVHMFARVCIDGACTPWESTGGAWVELARTTRVTTGATVVQIECRAEWPDQVNNDCWADAAWMRLEQ